MSFTDTTPENNAQPIFIADHQQLLPLKDYKLLVGKRVWHRWICISQCNESHG
ncbi:hypothetical protein P4S68_00515 [Pseudoalteromonas sp. Hal099]